MAETDDLDEQIAGLDPAARVVVTMLRQSMAELKTMLAQRDAEVARLTEQLEKLQRLLFGKRSEKIPPIESEVRRVVEADELTVDGTPMPEDDKARARERRRKARKKSEPERHRKRKLRKNLPVVHERVEVKETQLPPGYTLSDFRELSDGETVQRIEHVREHLVIVEYNIQKLASRHGDHIVRAEAPPSVIEGGHYGASVYAHVITAKCDDTMPLYRIARAMARAGCPIARSTLCSFFHRGSELLKPTYDGILDAARNDPYLHADETTFRLQAKGKGKCDVGWIWGLLSKRAIAYVFDVSRKGKVASKLIKGTKGVLIIDGYAGYDDAVAAVVASNEEASGGRTRAACWAHTRRYFFDAIKADPAAAAEVLKMIVALYRVEDEAAEQDILGTEAHLVLREKESAPVVARIEKWLDDRDGADPPKGRMAKAVTYAINRRKDLKLFLTDPKIPLDNNFAERGLRLFALGRKTFLFAGHAEGAQNLAVLQSIVATCRLHGVNPYEYLKDVLVRVQSHPAARVDELMPWNWAPAEGATLALPLDH